MEYNGITLDLLKTNRVNRESVYDDQGSYLYTVWEIDCNFVINPRTFTSYKGNPPAFTPGELASDTDEAIRAQLLQPRKLLVWTVPVDFTTQFAESG